LINAIDKKVSLSGDLESYLDDDETGKRRDMLYNVIKRKIMASIKTKYGKTSIDGSKFTP
jgi:hypothetical protein